MRSWLNNNLLLYPLAVPVIVITVILAVYYPALLSGIHPIDDPGIFAFFSAPQSLTTILSPGNSYYYRPLSGISFYLDNLFWGMSPGTMHLENILLHCANSLLVYFYVRRLLASHETDSRLLSLLAALLFAMHPVNVESVTWISGRTDPMLSLFVLSAGYFWIRWLENPRWQDLSATILLFGAALLTKETALAFCSVVLVFALSWTGTSTSRQRFAAIGLMVTPCLLLMVYALIFRSRASGLSRLISGMDLHFEISVWDGLTALGFYFKKLIFPFPLNFAITTVHPVYGFLGLLLLPALWWLFRNNRLSGVFVVSAVLLLIPAILISLKQVAWTPYAERYLYLSTAFFVVGLVGASEKWLTKYPDILPLFLVSLICGSALGSFQRNMLWKNSEAFFEDAVIKSPQFGSLYHSLGGILMQKGDVESASNAFSTAERLNQRVSMHYPIKSSIMGTKLAKSEYLEARSYFFRLFKKKQDAPVEFLELLYSADIKRFESVENVGKITLATDLLETLDLLYLKKPEPFWLYQSGKMALAAGNQNVAAGYFRKAYNTAPESAHFKSAAKKYLMKMETAK